MDRRGFIAAAALVPLAGCASRLPQADVADRAEGPANLPAAASWSPRTPMPWPVQEVYAAIWGHRIAIAGGLVAAQTEGGMTLHVEDRLGLYDPSTDQWRQGPRLPQARHHPMIVAPTLAGVDTLMAIGGYRQAAGVGDWINSREVWTLVPNADAWTPGPALPVPQAEAVGLSLQGRVHLITGRTPGGEANAGWTDQADVDAHWVLDEGVWRMARPCPMARNSAAGAVLGGALWVAGGRTVTGGGTGQLDRYDPIADRWDTLAPIPLSEATGVQVGGGLAMAALNGKLVAFGGEWFRPRSAGGGGGVFAETWIYDPASDAWTRGPDMTTPRHGLAAVSEGGRVYALAGGDVVSGGHATGVVEALLL